MNSATAAMKSTVQKMRSDRLLLAWNLSLVATFLLPLFVFAIARATNNLDDGGEQQQQDQYDEDGNYIGKYHWWQFWRSNNDQEDANNGEEGSPWWWFFSDERDPEEEGNGTLVFVYLWTIAMLITLAIAGNRLFDRGNLVALRWCLLGLANYSFLCMVLVAGLGAIEVEGRNIEETGWYGQTSVLLFLTCLFVFAKSLVFSCLVAKRVNDANDQDEKTRDLLNNGELAVV